MTNAETSPRSESCELRQTGDIGRLLRGNVLTVKHDRAAGRDQELGDQIKASGFAGAVRADQRMDGAAPNLQVNAVDRGKSLELFGQVPGFNDEFTCHGLRRVLP